MSAEEVTAIRRALEAGTLHPRTAKAGVGKAIVSLSHGPQAAEEAATEFDRIFREKGLPDDLEVFVVASLPVSEHIAVDVQADAQAGMAIPLVWLIKESGGTKSISQARRLIRQGGVSLDGDVVRDEHFRVSMDREHLLRVGKRFFRRIKLSTQ